MNEGGGVFDFLHFEIVFFFSVALAAALYMTHCPSPALSVCLCISALTSTQLAHFLVFFTTHFSRELISVAK